MAKTLPHPAIPEPGRDCPLCPRLVAFRLEARAAHPDWWNAPVPSFGPLDARLLIVGLAPGMQGANRTGRPFTGDGAGNFLYPKLLQHGLARGSYRADPKDGLELVDCRISNSARCVPPENKPTPLEVRTCTGTYLKDEIAAMPSLRTILALGRIAHDAVSRTLECKPLPAFGHGNVHALDAVTLVDSYHCSRYNLNTGTLTPAMFDAALDKAKASL
ncbi:MAG: uracil-DNA glycosylase [Alphaproteobacteria bacterium]|nr:uracil-DNA glycosylase [Alphaproteobacteria bacterium]